MRRYAGRHHTFGLVVSIHASVKDATLTTVWPTMPTFRFNPRICKRCDRLPVVVILPGQVSIHASVKDATHHGLPVCPSRNCFNPRICKRCDTDLGRITPVFTVSIHASVKDATCRKNKHSRGQKVSIHASVKDATFGSCL